VQNFWDYTLVHYSIEAGCNGMVEKMIKTLKHGLTIVFSANIQRWDVQVPRILFGYQCGIQISTKYSPYMILTRIPRLTIDNRLSSLTHYFSLHFTINF